MVGTRNRDPLESYVVNTTYTEPNGTAEEVGKQYVCTCGFVTVVRRDFQEHLVKGRLTGCGPRDLDIHVTDTIGAADVFG